MDNFSRGYQEPMNLTVGSVRTLKRLARSMGKQLMIDSAEIARQLFDSTVQAQLGYTEATLPGLFIPETYQVYWDMSADELIERMRKEHERFWNKERLAQATAIGMTPEEVSTLASIVEEETNNNEEKPIVAGSTSTACTKICPCKQTRQSNLPYRILVCDVSAFQYFLAFAMCSA